MSAFTDIPRLPSASFCTIDQGAIRKSSAITMPSKECHSTEEDASVSSAPPLDEVTVVSETDRSVSFASNFDDDLSSVSSMEDDDRDDTMGPPRSIFGSYWEKKGLVGLRRHAPTTDQSDNESLSTTGNRQGHETSSIEMYERMLKQTETYEASKATKNQPEVPRRRSIFQHTQSLPELCVGPPPRLVQKARSTSALLHPKPSCLRRRRNTRNLKVNFSSNVEVVEFPPPTVLYASKGWSDYFV